MIKSQPGAIDPDTYEAVYELINAVLSYRDATTPGLQAHHAVRMFNAASDAGSWLAPEHQWDYQPPEEEDNDYPGIQPDHREA